MTEVRVDRALLRGRYNADSFRDVADETVELAWEDRGRTRVVRFAATLTPEQVDVVRLRLTSRDDVEAAAKVALAEQVAQVAEWSPPTEQAATAAFARTSKTRALAAVATEQTEAERIAALEGRASALEAQVAALTSLLGDLTHFTTDYPA